VKEPEEFNRVLTNPILKARHPTTKRSSEFAEVSLPHRKRQSKINRELVVAISRPFGAVLYEPQVLSWTAALHLHPKQIQSINCCN
jgi:hypothetical protein